MNALLIIDVQNDFCSGGTLEVPGAEKIIPVINHYCLNSASVGGGYAVSNLDYWSPRYSWAIFTQDWHPPDHGSFASQHPGKQPFEMGELNGQPQMLWPDHCVHNSDGSKLHKDLIIFPSAMLIRKGMDPAVDCYSAFYDRAGKPTELVELLRRLEVKALDMCGLTTDYCVKETVLDALKDGYSVRVLSDAVKAVNPDTDALGEMRKAGAKIS